MFTGFILPFINSVKRQTLPSTGSFERRTPFSYFSRYNCDDRMVVNSTAATHSRGKNSMDYFEFERKEHLYSLEDGKGLAELSFFATLMEEPMFVKLHFSCSSADGYVYNVRTIPLTEDQAGAVGRALANVCEDKRFCEDKSVDLSIPFRTRVKGVLEEHGVGFVMPEPTGSSGLPYF